MSSLDNNVFLRRLRQRSGALKVMGKERLHAFIYVVRDSMRTSGSASRVEFCQGLDLRFPIVQIR